MPLPFRFKYLHPLFKNKVFNFLDVGCGNNSPLITKKWFPKIKYYGIDHPEAQHQELLCEKYWPIDLNNTRLDDLPNSFFDVVNFSHVIEHLNDGEKTVIELTKKVKPGGFIYIEFPSVRSLNLPSMKDTLNFCDDDTHVRIYSILEISNLLMQNGFKIIKAGPRRDWRKIFLLPFTVVGYLVFLRPLNGGIFWDLLGFADFIIAVKK